jgi:hypothetical protein
MAPHKNEESTGQYYLDKCLVAIYSFLQNFEVKVMVFLYGLVCLFLVPLQSSNEWRGPILVPSISHKHFTFSKPCYIQLTEPR